MLMSLSTGCAPRLLVLFLSASSFGCGADEGADEPSERERYLNETTTNWAMVRGYPRGTAYNPHEQQLSLQTVADLQIRWEVASDAASLIQHGERVFASDGSAYDLESGELLWANPLEASSVVCKGLVVSTGSRIDGRLTGTGAATLQSSVSDGMVAFGPPAAKDGKVVFSGVAEGWESRGEPTPGRVFSYDVAARAVDEMEVPYLTLAPAALSNGQLYSTAIDPAAGAFELVAFAVTIDSQTAGKRREWATVIGGQASPELPSRGVAVLDGHVFVASGDGREILSLEQRSGAVAWRRPSIATISSFAVNFDDVYTVGSDDNGELWVQSFAAGSGALRYSQALGQGEAKGQLAIGGDVLYVGTTSGELVALSAGTGSVLKRLGLGGEVASPLVARGSVLLTTGTRIVALGLPQVP